MKKLDIKSLQDLKKEIDKYDKDQNRKRKKFNAKPRKIRKNFLPEKFWPKPDTKLLGWQLTKIALIAALQAQKINLSQPLPLLFTESKYFKNSEINHLYLADQALTQPNKLIPFLIKAQLGIGIVNTHWSYGVVTAGENEINILLADPTGLKQAFNYSNYMEKLITYFKEKCPDKAINLYLNAGTVQFAPDGCSLFSIAGMFELLLQQGNGAENIFEDLNRHVLAKTGNVAIKEMDDGKEMEDEDDDDEEEEEEEDYFLVDDSLSKNLTQHSVLLPPYLIKWTQSLSTKDSICETGIYDLLKRRTQLFGSDDKKSIVDLTHHQTIDEYLSKHIQKDYCTLKDRNLGINDQLTEYGEEILQFWSNNPNNAIDRAFKLIEQYIKIVDDDFYKEYVSTAELGLNLKRAALAPCIPLLISTGGMSTAISCQAPGKTLRKKEQNSSEFFTKMNKNNPQRTLDQIQGGTNENACDDNNTIKLAYT